MSLTLLVRVTKKIWRKLHEDYFKILVKFFFTCRLFYFWQRLESKKAELYVKENVMSWEGNPPLDVTYKGLLKQILFYPLPY